MSINPVSQFEKNRVINVSKWEKSRRINDLFFK